MVLVFVEHSEGKFKKAAFEAVTFARKSADNLGASVTALTLSGAEDAGQLGEYGADAVVVSSAGEAVLADNQSLTAIIHEVANEVGATLIIFNHSSLGKSVAGRVAIRMDAGLVSGAIEPVSGAAGNVKVRKSVFSGKAYATYNITSEKAVVTVMANALPVEGGKGAVEVSQHESTVGAAKIEVVSTNKQTGVVPLPEAELVVSAGRGMKGPENWGIIEELAETLGATTACSRPVADADWRPHHEHVGQTGIAIRPNLYIAIGISGAIQHLAGVNNSKVIVVINKDPEAPFFKAADYGVVGDAFEVVPRLTEAIKKAQA